MPQDQTSVFASPGFDEYILGYKNRDAVLDIIHAEKICPGGNGMFALTIVINGRVAGMWKCSFKKSAVSITAIPFKTLSKAERHAFGEAIERYAAFISMSATLLKKSGVDETLPAMLV